MTNPEAGGEDVDRMLWAAALNAGGGDLRAFELLVQQHHRRIVANCRYLTRDHSSAEDLAQEVFVKAYFGRRTFEGRSSFRRWLQSIKVHHCLNHLRSTSFRKEKVSIDETAPESFESLRVPANAEREMEAKDNQQMVARILESLPSTLRIPLIMRDMDELPYEDIANRLGVGLSAVKMRVKRAREAFRQQYQLTARREAPDRRG